VVGAPGIGKSRLAREFLASLRGEGRVLVGRCLPYGEGITYWPLIEVVRQAAGAEVRPGLEALLASEKEEEGEEALLVVERLAAALGLSDAPAPSEEIFWAARIFLERIARERPLVVVLDDVHWAEATLLDLIEYLLGFASGPLVLVCSARPDLFDTRPDWSRPRPRARTVVLEPLPAADAELLVERLPAGAALPERLRGRILETAEGNPLFIEQMLALVREGGNGELAVPPTVQALLAERLDRLPRGERAIAEVGSVEGRLFHRGTVAAVLSEGDRDLLGAGLVALVRKDLIRADRSEFPGDDGFRFAHMLIRDAAYGSIPKRRRAELHERLALLFEARSSPDEVVGYHFEQASLRLAELGASGTHARALADRASDLLAAAGRRATARGDDRAAANLLRRARALLPPGDARLPPLGLALAEALFLAGEPEEAEALCREAMELASAHGDARTEWLATTHHVLVKDSIEPESWNSDEVRRTAKQALAVFGELDDDLGLARAWALAGYVDWNACRFESAAKEYERGLAHARRSGDLRTHAYLAGNLIAALYYGAAPVPEAIARIEELVAEVGSRALEASALKQLAGLHTMQGDFDEGRALYEQSKAICRELGLTLSLATATMSVREIHLLAGDAEGAERELRWGYETLEQMGEKGRRSTLAGNLAEALYQQRRYEEADHFALAGLEAASPEDIASQVMGQTVRAKLLAVKGMHDDAEQTVRTAVTLAEGTDDLFTLGQTYWALAEVLLLANRREEAIAALQAAAEASDRKGNLVTAKKARALLATLEPVHSTDASV
jgi:tetratricopeptide (TPR) repeat protein